MNWKEPLKREWEKNPLTVLVVTALVSNAAARLMNAWSSRKGRNAYVRQVNYRVGNK